MADTVARIPRTDVVVADALTKRFGDLVAVDDLSFPLPPGTITGFLGPNGAGKTTTLRMLAGLATTTSGWAFVFGRSYAELDGPSRRMGAVLEASDCPSRGLPSMQARRLTCERTVEAGGRSAGAARPTYSPRAVRMSSARWKQFVLRRPQYARRADTPGGLPQRVFPRPTTRRCRARTIGR